MRELLGNIRTDIIPTSTKKMKNEVKAWKYGYNSDFDVIIVSKDGTLGDIYEIEGMKIGLPALPTDKTKIINHELLPYQQ